MIYCEKFHQYYLNYLGIVKDHTKDESLIISCLERDKPINKWHYQYLIVSYIEGRRIFSISPFFIKDFQKYMPPFIHVLDPTLLDILQGFFESRINNYSIRKMYRMNIEKNPSNIENNSKVIKLTKEILMNHLKDENENVKEEIWERKKDEVEQGRQYVILNRGKIVSYCKISDICYGAGNIVVYTNENFRNMGYGRQVLQATVNWCFDNNILPIYWVWDKNLASIKLAKSIGFQIKCEEIVVGT